MTITPVLLCGGSGTRLWPLSRKSYPKQFAPLLGDETLFQASARRVTGDSFLAPIIVTNADFRFIVTEQLAAVGIDPGAILIEPAARNTAPAILAAAEFALEGDPDAMLLVAPSDHVVPDATAFRTAVAAGTAAARAGQLVTFGIEPAHPETGYGYLELSEEPKPLTPIPLQKFVEKPDRATAEAMVESGRFLWNSGIFLFSARSFVAAVERHASDLLDPVGDAVRSARSDLGFLRLATEPWARCRDVSVDYAVMEHADNLVVIPYRSGWSDLGGWDAVWRHSDRDATGVSLSGAATSIDCTDTLLRSEFEGQAIVGIGLENIVAVAMPDAVLVADMSRAQDVKRAVAALRQKGTKQAEAFPKDHRPWGWFETLVLGDRFQVKRILVHPGQSLSLQSHVHRSEHWIVVAGTAKVTIDTSVQLLSENQSVYIPLGAVHRLENPGKVPVVLIEVQTGTYLGEDDITRYDDMYARP